MKLTLHCVEKFTKVAESQFNGQGLIEQFRTSKGTTRNLLGGADTTMLMVKLHMLHVLRLAFILFLLKVSKGVPMGGGFIAGAAYNGFWLPVGWAAKQGETWVTFAHEISHMFSADHDQVHTVLMKAAFTKCLLKRF